jgi:uncharacterized protein DUF6496
MFHSKLLLRRSAIINRDRCCRLIWERGMARKYSRGAQKYVKRAMRKRKKGTLKSGRSGKTVKSRRQAVAIGLSEARKKGAKVPRKKRI